MNETREPSAIFTTIGAALIVIGCFMPWVSATSGFGTVSRSGLDGGDGLLLLPVGILIGVIGVSRLGAFEISVRLEAAEKVLLIVAAALVVFNFVTTSSRVSDASNEFVDARVGAGLYVAGIGVAVSAWGWFTRRQEQASHSADASTPPGHPPT